MKVKIAAVAVIGLGAVGTLYSGLRAQDAPSGTRSVWDGVYTQEQAERGHSLYNRHCASCHGDELAGGDVPPPLAGSGFLANWNGLTVGDLFERIRRSMPAQPATKRRCSGLHFQLQQVSGRQDGTGTRHRAIETDSDRGHQART